MIVTATEFKNNLGKYLALIDSEDVFITKNGKSIAKLSGVKESRIEIAKSLFGILPDTGMTIEKAREERLSKYERID